MLKLAAIRRLSWLGALCGLCTAPPLTAQQQEYTIHGTEIRVRVHVQLTAGELYDRCNFDLSAPPPDAFICVGYLTGAEDGMTIILAANGLPLAFCKPDDVRREVLLAAFVDYVRADPRKRELPAALVILQAYRQAFPCPTGVPPQ